MFSVMLVSAMHGAGANFVFCDGSVHFISSGIATDASQENCNHPVSSNNTFNLYFKDDGNILQGVDF